RSLFMGTKTAATSETHRSDCPERSSTARPDGRQRSHDQRDRDDRDQQRQREHQRQDQDRDRERGQRQGQDPQAEEPLRGLVEGLLLVVVLHVASNLWLQKGDEMSAPAVTARWADGYSTTFPCSSISIPTMRYCSIIICFMFGGSEAIAIF